MQVIWLVRIACTTLIPTLSLETENSICFSHDCVLVIASTQCGEKETRLVVPYKEMSL